MCCFITSIGRKNFSHVLKIATIRYFLMMQETFGKIFRTIAKKKEEIDF